jgi:hypothetical protein
MLGKDDILLARLIHVGQWEERVAAMKDSELSNMKEDMDKHIDLIIKRPAMYAGEFGLHQMNTAEFMIRTLLAYRYSDGIEMWERAVKNLWPEGKDSPRALGWMVKHLHIEDEDWTGWTETVKKVIEVVRTYADHESYLQKRFFTMLKIPPYEKEDE